MPWKKLDGRMSRQDRAAAFCSTSALRDLYCSSSRTALRQTSLLLRTRESMDQAARQQLIIANSRINFARNKLVLATSGNLASRITSLDDLKSGAVKRIAVSNPDSVP